MAGVTLRLAMPRFQEMLQVVLGPEIPDELSNKVLMVCTRPRDGITEVALEREEASLIAEKVAEAGMVELAGLLRSQIEAESEA